MGKLMDNYFYGKSGKGDFRKDDLPDTRMKLFRDTLRTRLSGLCRLNLIYMLIWIPAALVLLLNVSNLWNRIQTEAAISEYNYSEYAELLQSKEMELTLSEEDYNQYREYLQERDRVYADASYEAYLERVGADSEGVLTREQFQAVQTNGATEMQNGLLWLLIYLFPCIAITGPFTAGLSYVTRNWARDEHAFAWSDFKDAVKSNWKIPLLLSTITGALPALIYQGWITYGRMANQNPILMIPRMMGSCCTFLLRIKA